MLPSRKAGKVWVKKEGTHQAGKQGKWGGPREILECLQLGREGGSPCLVEGP